jgi:hypothetical protein
MGGPGGLVGGLFAVFNGIGLLFFTILIGQRAQHPSLRTHRVIIGGLLSGLVVGGILGAALLYDLPLPGLIGMGIGVVVGTALAGILLGYVSSLEEKEIQERQAAAAEEVFQKLTAKEKRRIQQARQQGIPFNEAEELRRADLVEQGIDPDDPHAVLLHESGSDSKSGCFIATAGSRQARLLPAVSFQRCMMA